MGKLTPRTVELARWERLRDSPRQVTSMSLPLAVHYRLDRLARLAEDVNASRAEIAAMLIAEAKLDVGDLESRVLAYRKLHVGDVAPSDPQHDDSDTVVVPLAKPGRPRKSEAS
jgi:hypothetical protein